MLNQSQSQPPESLPKKASPALARRPEEMFRRKQSLIFVVIAVAILGVCMFYGFTLMNPTKGLDRIASASGITPQATSLIQLQQVQQIQVSSASSGAFMSAVRCRALQDIPISAGLIPLQSQVTVTGFSYASGGMVLVSDPNVGWLSSLVFKCSEDVVKLERPYMATPVAVATGKAVASVRVVVITATPSPVLPVSSPTLANAVYVDGDCVLFNVSGVSALYVNGGTPVVGGGRYCGVKSFTVNK